MSIFMRKRCHSWFFIALLTGIVWSSMAIGASDPPSVQIVVRQVMDDLREHGKAPAQRVIEELGAAIIPAAEEYLQDPDRGVRLRAYMFIRRAGRQSKDSLVRQSVVDKLLTNCLKDAELKTSIFDGLLSDFQAADYSATAKQLLHTELATSPKYRIILLVGAADMKSELPVLKRLVDEIKNPVLPHGASKTIIKEPLQPFSGDRKKSHLLAFAALMARARMGVKEDIQECIELVESHPDEGFRVVNLLRRLSYVRQPEIVEYLKKYFFMDKIEPGPTTQLRLTYAERAMRALSEMLVDFPKGKDKKFETQEEFIEYNRKWLSEQTEWKIISKEATPKSF